jgi:hypothetical protein
MQLGVGSTLEDRDGSEWEILDMPLISKIV